MDRLTASDLRTLMERRAESCLSLFMPAHRKGKEVEQDPIRLKNLLREAEERLVATGMRSSEAGQLLAPARALLEGDGLFWQHQGDGLALFVAPDFFRSYRLPLPLNELVVVNDRFHVKPLVPLIADDGSFYILAVSQNEVRLFYNSRHSSRDVDLGDTPRSLAEAMKYEDPERQLQFHTGTQPARGERAAVFHGHGAGANEEKDRIFRFLRQVDDGLRTILHDGKAPLVLASVEYIHAVYAEATTYPHLVDKVIAGNSDGVDADTLRGRAWTILEQRFLEERKRAAERFGQVAGSERGLSEIAQVVPAAQQGRVDTLFVALGQQLWGKFDADSATVHVHPQAATGDEDLLDLAVVYTLEKRGAVYVVESGDVPGGKLVAAILRY